MAQEQTTSYYPSPYKLDVAKRIKPWTQFQTALEALYGGSIRQRSAYSRRLRNQAASLGGGIGHGMLLQGEAAQDADLRSTALSNIMNALQLESAQYPLLRKQKTTTKQTGLGAIAEGVGNVANIVSGVASIPASIATGIGGIQNIGQLLKKAPKLAMSMSDITALAKKTGLPVGMLRYLISLYGGEIEETPGGAGPTERF